MSNRSGGDLYIRLRNAIEERLNLAEAALPVAADQTVEHVAANDPAFVIRAAQADLNRLDEHKPVVDSNGLRWCPGHRTWSDCPELLRLESVYLPGRRRIPGRKGNPPS